MSRSRQLRPDENNATSCPIDCFHVCQAGRLTQQGWHGWHGCAAGRPGKLTRQGWHGWHGCMAGTAGTTRCFAWHGWHELFESRKICDTNHPSWHGYIPDLYVYIRIHIYIYIYLYVHIYISYICIWWSLTGGVSPSARGGRMLEGSMGVNMEGT